MWVIFETEETGGMEETWEIGGTEETEGTEEIFVLYSSIALIKGAIFMKLGRAPTTDIIFI